MNAITRHLDKQAKNGFTSFIEILTAATRHLKRELKVTEHNGENIDFSLDCYEFSLTWSESTRKALGRDFPVVAYQLYTWTTTPGGRWHPPESVDVKLLDSHDFYKCIACALKTVANEEIRQCLEAVGSRDCDAMERIAEVEGAQ